MRSALCRGFRVHDLDVEDQIIAGEWVREININVVRRNLYYCTGNLFTGRQLEANHQSRLWIQVLREFRARDGMELVEFAGAESVGAGNFEPPRLAHAQLANAPFKRRQ